MRASLDQIYSLFLKNSSISTDSRQIVAGCIFFALKGEHFNGNIYAHSALSAGAAYVVIDDEKFDCREALLVDDVLHTLQELATMHRRKYNFPVIAITGSNGKTTTKELVNAVLSSHYHVTATKGNFNNHIGVPLTLLSITNETQMVIVEMGANHQGEIEQLCAIAEPTHGLITNIGKAHLGGFGGYDGVIKAKRELYTWLFNSGGITFVNAENPLLMELSEGMNRILYGSHASNFTSGTAVNDSSRLSIEWMTGKEIIHLESLLVGDYNIENVLAAVCTGMFFNVPDKKIQMAIHGYTPSNSRSQALKTDKNSIILDAYNANPSSMQVAIENFRQLKALHKMVILGDMLELGDESLAEHSAITKLIEESGFEHILLVGPDFMQVAHSIFTCFETSEQARDWLLTQKIENFTILIKGSRGIKMEKVLEVL